MSKEEVKTEATKKDVKKDVILVDDVMELESTVVKGNFRGGYRQCPEREVNGVVYPARTQFKLSRRVKLADGRVVRQSVWIAEEDARAWGLSDGVRYQMEIEAGLEMLGDRNNGQDNGYDDEYTLVDAVIVRVNGKGMQPAE